MQTCGTDILAQLMRTERVETQVELGRWSSGNALLVGVLLTAAALGFVVWMYRREGRGHMTRPLRWSLVACRVGVLLFLGLIGLEPLLVHYIHRRLDAYTLVLVDESASMSLVDSYREPGDKARADEIVGDASEGVSRARIEESILTRDGGRLLNSLVDKNWVRIVRFSDRPKIVASLDRPDTGASEDPATAPDDAAHFDPGQIGAAVRVDPIGSTTDLGLAVRGAMDSLGGAPAAAIVLLSDGGFNQGESVAQVADLLRRQQVPLHAIGVGDPSAPINAAVVDVRGPHMAFKNDPFEITVRLAAENLDAGILDIELLERRGESAGSAKVVEHRKVPVSPEGRVEPVVFKCKVAEPGSVSYAARVAPAAQEAVLSDNQAEILPAVRILDDQMRVLLVAGAPSYDYRFLSRMLERDASVNLSTWLQSADVRAIRDGDTVITELPATPQALDEYDAVILIDCDPEEFDPTWGSLAASFVVDQGGGLLYAAGNKHTGRFFRSPKSASLVELLPIVPDPDAEILLNDLGQYQTTAWPIAIPPQALSDPILRFSENLMENRAIWSALDGVYWHYPVRREKPIAAALMRHSNPRMVNNFGPHVLFATQYVGAGRSAYLGFDSTWRWRRYDDSYFNRFWTQTLRYLVEGKLLGGGSRGLILTDKDRFEFGESVAITVRALDEQFNPLLLPQLEMKAAFAPDHPEAEGDAAPQEGSITLTPVAGREGYYQARFVPEQYGTVNLTLALPRLDTALAPAAGAVIQKQISVRRSEIEMRNTAMNRAALQDLAARTHGRYYEIDEADKIAEAIPDCSRTYVARQRPRALWDNAYCFVAVVALLTLEWILRKKAKLL